MSLGMPSRTSPSNSGVVISVQISSFKASILFARPNRRSPAVVSFMPRRSRVMSSSPSVSSSRLICWLTAAWVRLRTPVAAVIPPASTTATKALSRLTSRLRAMVDLNKRSLFSI